MESDLHVESIKVLLADDNPIFATGFALTLANYGIELIGEGSTPHDIFDTYDALRPDVVVMDVAFGGPNCGLSAARELLRVHANAKIVVMSQHDSDNLYKETYRIGAHAFVTKNRNAAELAAAVTTAVAGKLFFLPHIAVRLANNKIRGDDAPQDLLQRRELEVFKLMALGLTNLEIAEQLRLSAKSISNYSQTIKEKLGTQRAAELTRIAVRHGLIEP